MARRPDESDAEQLVRLLKNAADRAEQRSPSPRRKSAEEIWRAHRISPWLLWDYPRFALRRALERRRLSGRSAWRPVISMIASAAAIVAFLVAFSVRGVLTAGHNRPPSTAVESPAVASPRPSLSPSSQRQTYPQPFLAGVPTSPRPTPTRSGSQQSAAARLHATADRVRQLAEPPAQPVVYSRVQEWAVDNQQAGGQEEGTLTDVQTWWRPDRPTADGYSGYQRTTTLPRPLGPAAEFTTALPPQLPCRTDSVIHPSIGHPADLGQQLAAVAPGGPTAAGYLQAIATLYRQVHLTAGQRAEVLDLMAGLALDYVGPVHDRMNRPGDAYAAEGTSSRGQRTQYLVIIDSRTGALLDYERTLLHAAPGQTIHTPSLIQYRIYIANNTTTQQGTACGG